MEKFLVKRRDGTDNEILSAFHLNCGLYYVGADVFRLLDKRDFPSYPYEKMTEKAFLDKYKPIKRIGKKGLSLNIVKK